MKKLHKSMIKEIEKTINPHTGYVVVMVGSIQRSMHMDLRGNDKDVFIELLEKTLKHLKTNGKEGFNRDLPKTD